MMTVVLMFLAPEDLSRANSLMIITKKDNGKEITVRNGDTIRIELEASGGAGFTWEAEDLDKECLELVKEETKNISEGGLVGTPITRIWQLRARKAGETVITLYYYRAWEGKEKAVDKFEIRLKIL